MTEVDPSRLSRADSLDPTGDRLHRKIVACGLAPEPISDLTRHEIPIDGVVIDTTVTPRTINLFLPGIRIVIPVTAEIEQQLRTKPRNYHLFLEIT